MEQVPDDSVFHLQQRLELARLLQLAADVEHLSGQVVREDVDLGLEAAAQDVLDVLSEGACLHHELQRRDAVVCQVRELLDDAVDRVDFLLDRRHVVLKHRHFVAFRRLQPLDHPAKDQTAVLVDGGLDRFYFLHPEVQSVDLGDELVSLLQQRVLDQEGELLFSVCQGFVQTGDPMQLCERRAPGCCAGRR